MQHNTIITQSKHKIDSDIYGAAHKWRTRKTAVLYTKGHNKNHHVSTPATNYCWTVADDKVAERFSGTNKHQKPGSTYCGILSNEAAPRLHVQDLDMANVSHSNHNRRAISSQQMPTFECAAAIMLENGRCPGDCA